MFRDPEQLVGAHATTPWLNSLAAGVRFLRSPAASVFYGCQQTILRYLITARCRPNLPWLHQGEISDWPSSLCGRHNKCSYLAEAIFSTSANAGEKTNQRTLTCALDPSAIRNTRGASCGNPRSPTAAATLTRVAILVFGRHQGSDTARPFHGGRFQTPPEPIRVAARTPFNAREISSMSLLRKPRPTRNAVSQLERDRSSRRHATGGSRNSRPRVELLEDRTLLAIDMVGNSNADSSASGSLHEMPSPMRANPGDTIEFDMSAGHVTSPITLTGGVLSVAQNVKIQGPGASDLTISGNSASTVFSIVSGEIVTISGLTIANGYSASSAGGIDNLGHLTLTDDVLSDNSGALAGGIFSQSGSVSMSDCTSTQNNANSASGGAIYVLSGAVTIKGSTFSSNSASFFGGAIFNNAGTVSLTNSTFSGNSAQEGGAIDNYGTLTLINSTVADNTSQGDGGGISNDVSGTLTIGNTIVADNAANVAGPDLSGALTTDLGNNLVSDTSGSSGLTQPTDLLNVEPDLAPPKNNGGPTQTISLMTGSPAIDAGNNALIPPGIVTDQRGFARIANGTVDIGAFESQLLLVYNTADHGAGSLRAAMTDANQAGGSTILFATSGVITLQSALPAISDDVSLVGPGATSLSVDGNALYQVFDIQSGATVSISGLTITDGSSIGNGGAIENDGGLTLTSCTVSASSERRRWRRYL